MNPPLWVILAIWIFLNVVALLGGFDYMDRELMEADMIPTEDRCCDGGEHSDSLEGLGGDCAMCKRCGTVYSWESYDWYLRWVPTCRAAYEKQLAELRAEITQLRRQAESVDNEK